MTTITQSNENLVLNHIGTVPCFVELSKAENALKEETGMDLESLGVYKLVESPNKIGEISVSPRGGVYISTWDGDMIYSQAPNRIPVRNHYRNLLFERLGNPQDKMSDEETYRPYFHLR